MILLIAQTLCRLISLRQLELLGDRGKDAEICIIEALGPMFGNIQWFSKNSEVLWGEVKHKGYVAWEYD
jgi:hypothetical protein